MSVSVLIPAYNAERTIVRALDSVFAQTIVPQEVIVVDDGSVDRTVELVQGYHAGNVKLIKQKNAGAAAARNAAANHASGEYYAFLDADDCWSATKLEFQLEAMRVIPDASVCFCRAMQIDEASIASAKANNEKKLPSHLQADDVGIVSIETAVLSPYWGTPNVLMRASLFHALDGFDESLVTAEDVDLWLRAALHSKVCKLNVTLTYVVLQPDSLSMSQGRDIYLNHLKVLDRIASHKGLKPSLLRRARSQVLEHWGSALLCEGDCRRAAAILMRSCVGQLRARNIYLFLKSLFCVVLR